VIAVDGEFNDLIFKTSSLYGGFRIQFLSTKFIITFHPLALILVLYDRLNGTRYTTHAAGNFIFGINLHYYFGRVFHKAIVAAWALVVISLTAE